ncbi:prostaglandin F synthase 1-like [Diorhabda sublineata]|uniref:prostaglandin F synthase 1-like n=1 Tax=Diorhabda sublineata TaxID=1163346 RepID=UPI0024E103A8|nr:prostaglandin F synthase 1-like [Diorhabda sublineata]
MNNGKKIPSIGIGTFTVTKETELTTALNEALKIGYRHIDTATFYQNEHIIGNVLNKWLTSGQVKREDLFVTTKLHIIDSFPEKVEEAVKSSLEKLQLEYIDLLLIHCPVSCYVDENGGFVPAPTDHIGVWKKMEVEVDAGRVKSIGLSNFNMNQIEKIRASARIPPANIQVEIHPYHQQKKLREYCKKHDIVIVAYSSLGAPGVNHFYRAIGWHDHELPGVLTNPEIVRIAKKHKRSPAQIALRFALQLDLAVIPKSTNPERLKENFHIFDFDLSDEDMNDIEGLEQGIQTKIIDLKFLSPIITQHPEYPYKELIE